MSGDSAQPVITLPAWKVLAFCQQLNVVSKTVGRMFPIAAELADTEWLQRELSRQLSMQDIQVVIVTTKIHNSKANNLLK